MDSKLKNTLHNDKTKGKMNIKYNFYTITKFNADHTQDKNCYNNSYSENKQMPVAKMGRKDEQQR